MAAARRCVSTTSSVTALSRTTWPSASSRRCPTRRATLCASAVASSCATLKPIRSLPPPSAPSTSSLGWRLPRAGCPRRRRRHLTVAGYLVASALDFDHAAQRLMGVFDTPEAAAIGDPTSQIGLRDRWGLSAGGGPRAHRRRMGHDWAITPGAGGATGWRGWGYGGMAYGG
ncbi:hypothetical protein ACP70R_010621 [Stipagrostis hirtigluma subsp. patula]